MPPTATRSGALLAEDRRIGLYSVQAVYCIARLYTRVLYTLYAIQIRDTGNVSCIGRLRAVLILSDFPSHTAGYTTDPIVKHEI